MMIKLELLGYRTVKNLGQYVKPSSYNTGTSRTNGQMDRQTDRQTDLLYQYRASVLTRDKNRFLEPEQITQAK